MRTTCTQCQQTFDSPSGKASTCGATCRKREQRARKATAEATEPIGTTGTGTEPSEPPLVARVRADLKAAGRLGTIAGEQALILARQMCGKYHTISGMSTVSKELSRVLADALQGAVIVTDGVDDLRARRDAKRAKSA